MQPPAKPPGHLLCQLRPLRAAVAASVIFAVCFAGFAASAGAATQADGLHDPGAIESFGAQSDPSPEVEAVDQARIASVSQRGDINGATVPLMGAGTLAMMLLGFAILGLRCRSTATEAVATGPSASGSGPSES